MKKIIKIIILISATSLSTLLSQNAYFGLKYAEKILSVDDGLGPLHLKEGNQIRLGELIHSRLWRYNHRLQLEPDILASLPVDDVQNGKEALLCELKNDLQWSDGRPITIEDIVFTIDFYKKNSRQGSKIFSIVSETTVKPIDEKSFYLMSGVKNFHYLARMNFPLIQIMPKHVVGSINFYRDDKIWEKPVSSGPFLIDEIEKDGQARTVYLERNKYSQERPDNWEIQNVIAVSEPSFQPVIDAMMVENKLSYDNSLKSQPHRGYDLLFQGVRSRSVVNTLNNKTHIRRQQYVHNSWVGIIFNHDRPFINSVDFRKSFDEAIDDTSLISTYYPRGGAIDLTGPFNPFLGVTEQIEDRRTNDPQTVLEQFLSQGFEYNKDKNILNWIDPSSGERTSIELTLIYNKKFAELGTPEKNVIDNIKETFREDYGIKINTDGLSSVNFLKRLKERNKWDLALLEFNFGWSGNVTPIFKQGSRSNIAKYKSNILENDLDLLLSAKNSNQRAEIIKRIHRYCHENLPYLFLWHVRPVVYYRDIIQDPTFTPQYFFTTMGRWGIKPR